MKSNWHCGLIDEIIEYLTTNTEVGLSTTEVDVRLQAVGFNELNQKKPCPWWRKFIMQFQDFMVVVLLGATLISACLGEYADAITILAIVLTNATLGFVQEYRAEQSLVALKRLSAPVARVIRNGISQQIPAREIVPGDIIQLEAGDKVGADARLVETQHFEVEESALTGESLPVRKVALQVCAENAQLADRKNMIFAATTVTRGRAKAVACATGMETEVGHIADMLQCVREEKTPLEKRLENLGRWLVWGCLGICVIVVITGILKGEPIFLMCMAGISLAVAAIPEGLPAIVTVSLALGMQRMIRRNAIVRKLPAVETLGCVTVICSDKTGTLTQNAMTVRKIWSNGKTFTVTGQGYDIGGEIFYRDKTIKNSDFALRQCLLIGCLCNNSVLKHNQVSISGYWRKKNDLWQIEGDPTEGAMLVVAGKVGLWRDQLEKKSTRVVEIPFESERRRMSVIYRDSAMNYSLYSKGAPSVILSLCRYYQEDTTRVELNSQIRQKILQQVDDLTSQSLRVLAVAYRPSLAQPDTENAEEMEQDLVFAGLVGMMDPPRSEVKPAIKLCRQAGIKIVMITGDHKNTALAIAKELNMMDIDDLVMTGEELTQLTDRELQEVVNKVKVYARVSPSHKLRIVRALKGKGHIVAMTGDGVNDAPAIKEADVGIAMGLSGTEVTKEASSITLADDNFATIVAAVEEGRGIYDNIRKFIRYLLACNLGEVLTMFGASICGMPLPMLPVQVLWVNLITDGLPAMALGVDPKDDYIMQRPPRNPNESAFSRGLSRKIIARGLQIGISSLLVFGCMYYYGRDLMLARTMGVTTLVFCQMFHVFDCRSEVNTVFSSSPFKNKYLVYAVLWSVCMQIAVIYHPLLQKIFATKPLSAQQWGFVLLVSGWTFLLAGLKHIFIKRKIMQRYRYCR